MGEIVSFRRARRWTRASDYGVAARGRRAGNGGRGGGWLAAARDAGPILWAAPLAACTAVFLMLQNGASEEAHVSLEELQRTPVTQAELRRRIWPGTPEELDAQQPDLSQPDVRAASRGSDGNRARFASCAFAGRDACVIDGDTFWYRGTKIRVADINTPETSSPKCAAEAELGAKATARFTQLLNAGPFSLESVDRAQDRYGRALFTVTRGGESLGTTLVNEGLAERWQGYRREWC